MRLFHPTAPIILLSVLSPVLSASDRPGSVSHLASDKQKVPGPQHVPGVASAPDARPELGTKDAPVDGQDGKPHAGPFVDKPKKPLIVEDLDAPSSSTSKEKEKLLKDTFEDPNEDPGVMRVDQREGAQVKGPTGTEGGVSAKEKDGKSKRPEQPKEATKFEDIGGNELEDKQKPKSESDKKKGAAGLEKPEDLPDTPHDIPHPKPNLHGGVRPSRPTYPEPQNQVGLQPLHSLVLSFTMILFSEIGDKTFLIAALMAMRHPRSLVFSAAFSALVFMTVLSALLGHAVPTLLPKQLTTFAAAVLFLVFGVRLTREGLAMSKDAGVGEEMLEVEMELEEKEAEAVRKNKRRGSDSNLPYIVEEARSPSPSRLKKTSPTDSIVTGLSNLCGLLLSPAWVQTFIMTFLGEWGDRSQIATIAMAAGKDYWWVTIGAIAGHSICTAIAVIGGRAIAGRVSMRIVTLGGGVAFLVFGFLYGAESFLASSR